MASARRLESIEDLREHGCEVVALDVTDEASRRAVVAAIEERDGFVAALVNNAGYSQSGAVESVSLDRVRRQFETNVFGPLELAGSCCRACGEPSATGASSTSARWAAA